MNKIAGMLAGIVLLIAPMAARGQALDDAQCRAMQPKASLGFKLPGIAAQRAAAERIRIVAIGSSSTEGPRVEDRSGTYPTAMARTLRSLWPDATIEVINKGKGGETTSDMLNRFDADVIDLGPSLVIWQLGANDVLRYDSVRGLEPLMAGGMRRLAEKGIPVVLFDLQYAPKIIADTDHKAMTELIEKLARDYSAGLFRRFAIMRTLIENDPALPARVIESDGLHMTAAMHRCLGQLLASGIAESAQPELATRR